MEIIKGPTKPGRPRGLPKTGGKPETARLMTCPVCGAEKSVPASDIRDAKTWTCSRKCAGALKHTTRTVTLPCTYCGKDVTMPISKISTTGNAFCQGGRFTCYLPWRHGRRPK